MTRVALVVLDTLRKDAFDEHFDWLPGMRFENAWSTSHWTVPAHASLFTGKYGSEVGVHANSQSLDNPEPVLAEELAERGVTTRAFSANPNISRLFGFNRGFVEFRGSWRVRAMRDDLFDWDRFISENLNSGVFRFPKAVLACLTSDCATVPSLKYGAQMKLRDLGWGSVRGDGVEEASSYVSRLTPDEDDFLFINLMEAHTPYDPPEPYNTGTVTFEGMSATLGEPESDPDEIRAAYDGAVRYLSDQYRELFGQLREKYDIVLTVSDHGEMLGEHGVWEHLYGLYPELTRVPLVVSGDAISGGGTTDTLVNLFDVHETVRRRFGLDERGRGADLLNSLPQNERELLTEYHGLSDKHYERLRDDGHEGIEYLSEPLSGFLTDSYYGFETHKDGFIECGIGFDVEEARERLATLTDALEKRETGNDAVEISATAQANLEDLGYM